ncbi:MAG TPA: hypothetical protein PLS29_06340 [Acidimicrobiales bacterium]|nr:hypothetical protein [Acidimicrobiales bacterium]
MAGFVVTVRERTRAGVSLPLVLWAIAMAVVLVREVVAPSPSDVVYGALASALLGAYLGVRRRVGTVLIAPLVSWLFAAPPLLIASMVHSGVVKGFLLGVLLVTFGWVGVALSEVVVVGLVALAARVISGGRRERPIVYFEPGERPR